MASSKWSERVASLVAGRLEKVMSDRKNAERLAKAIGALQQGRQAVEEAQGRFYKTMGVVSRTELENMKRKVSSLGRKIRQVEGRFDAGTSASGSTSTDDGPATLQ